RHRQPAGLPPHHHPVPARTPVPVPPARLQLKEDAAGAVPCPHATAVTLHLADGPPERPVAPVPPALGAAPALVAAAGAADENAPAGGGHHRAADQPAGGGGGGVDHLDGVGDLVDEEAEGHPARPGSWGPGLLCGAPGREERGARKRVGLAGDGTTGTSG